MRFAHLADVHIGAWRDPAMKGLSLAALKRAVAIIIEKKLDFAIIAGDLFNTAVPAIDHLQETVILLKKLKVAGIPVYVVPGSHDYSAAGKTILDVLEEADLLHNVMKGEVFADKLSLKFTTDQKTGVKLTGIGGRRGSLEQKEYAHLDTDSLEAEPGQKIFLFHTSIDELKPDEMYAMLSVSINEFPQGFDYYAGGHVHVVDRQDFPGRKNVIYPGPIFPAGFHELWALGRGGFFIYDEGSVEYHPINLKSTFKIDVNAGGKSPEEVYNEIDSIIKLREFNNTIVMLRIHGVMKSGKPSDIDFKTIFKTIYGKSAYFVMRSTTQLSSEEFNTVKVTSGSSDEIEDEAVSSYLASKKGGAKFDASTIKSLMQSMSDEQKDGEKKYEYELRIKEAADRIFGG